MPQITSKITLCPAELLTIVLVERYNLKHDKILTMKGHNLIDKCILNCNLIGSSAPGTGL